MYNWILFLALLFIFSYELKLGYTKALREKFNAFVHESIGLNVLVGFCVLLLVFMIFFKQIGSFVIRLFGVL